MSKSLKILESNPVKMLATFQGRVAVGWRGEGKKSVCFRDRGKFVRVFDDMISMMILWQTGYYPEELNILIREVI